MEITTDISLSNELERRIKKTGQLLIFLGTLNLLLTDFIYLFAGLGFSQTLFFIVLNSSLCYTLVIIGKRLKRDNFQDLEITLNQVSKDINTISIITFLIFFLGGMMGIFILIPISNLAKAKKRILELSGITPKKQSNESSNSITLNQRSIVEEDNSIIRLDNSENVLMESLLIPEPTKSLVWITDEDPSLAESPMSITMEISLDEEGDVTSEIKQKGFYAEPSLIWSKLPIEKNNELETGAMYWPRYVSFSPKQRYQYLNWLRDVTQPTNLSYVFLYFYGLERHMLIGQYDKAVDEVIRLIKYHDKGSFTSYATRSLIMASIARKRMDIIKRFPTILEEELDEALALRIMLGSPLRAQDVISLSSRVGFKNRRYINLYPDLFESILEEKIQEFEDIHGPILKVFDIKSFAKEARSIFANLSIPEKYRIVQIPQIVTNAEFKTAIFTMLQNTHEIIKSNSLNPTNKKFVIINEDRQVNRNLRGIELEKTGKINQAKRLYEKNLNENFEGSHPYTRLAAIYHKTGQIDEEIRVLRKAVYVFENLASKGRADRLPKLEKYKTRLKNAEKRNSNKKIDKKTT